MKAVHNHITVKRAVLIAEESGIKAGMDMLISLLKKYSLLEQLEYMSQYLAYCEWKKK
jgi:hypothetical protein